MGLQYERPWLKNQRSTLTFETYLYPLKLIYTHCLIMFNILYQVRIMTLASTVFKKSTFQQQKNPIEMHYRKQI